MIILTSNSMSSSIYSGLIAAVISGVVGIIGYVLTTNVQTKNGKEAIKMQKEIAEMQKNQKLFYESQLEWANDTRKLIAKFISDSFRLNIIVKNIESIYDRVLKLDFDKSDEEDIAKKTSDNIHKAGELLSALNEEATMIRLYLFHKDNDHEKEVFDMIDRLENDMNGQLGIDSKLLNEFVDVARDYFNYQIVNTDFKM